MPIKSHKLSEIAEIRSDFKRLGVSHISGVFTPKQIEELRHECDLLWDQQTETTFNNLRFGLRQDLNGNTVLDRLDPVADISNLFDELNSETALVTLAENLLGQQVQVMKEKLIFKRPGTGGFGLHRDGPYFGSSGASGGELASITILLDDFNSQNGPIQFYPELRMKNLRSPADESRDIDIIETQDHKPLVPLAHAGDILAFDGLIPHCSNFNRSSESRRIYMITYIPTKYEKGREKYYRQRLAEQSEERRQGGRYELKLR